MVQEETQNINDIIRQANDNLSKEIKEYGRAVLYEQLPDIIKKDLSEETLRKQINRINKKEDVSKEKEKFILRITKQTFLLSEILNIMKIDLHTLFDDNCPNNSATDKEATFKVLDQIYDKIEIINKNTEQNVINKHPKISLMEQFNLLYNYLSYWNFLNSSFYNQLEEKYITPEDYTFNLIQSGSYFLKQDIEAKNKGILQMDNSSFIFYLAFCELQRIYPEHSQYTEKIKRKFCNIKGIAYDKIDFLKLYILYTIYFLLNKLLLSNVKIIFDEDKKANKTFFKLNSYSPNIQNETNYYNKNEENKENLLKNIKKYLHNLKLILKRLLNTSLQFENQNDNNIRINHIDRIIHDETDFIYNNLYLYSFQKPQNQLIFLQQPMSPNIHIEQAKIWSDHFYNLLITIADIENDIFLQGHSYDN